MKRMNLTEATMKALENDLNEFEDDSNDDGKYKVTVTISDDENSRSFEFIPDSKDFDKVFDELYNYILF